MRFMRTFVGLVAAVAVLSSCSSIPAEPVKQGAVTASPAKTAVKAGKVGKPRPTSVVREDGTIPFGESFKYGDGLIVTVSKPKKVFVGEFDRREGYNRYVRFVVVIKNTGKKSFDPGLASINIQSGDSEGADTYTGDNPETNILPSRSGKWTMTFGVKKATDLVVQVAPSWNHEEKLWR